MAATQIICTNCGAKYRIPETFKGNRAKCKACGTVIDVAAQRDAETSAGPEVAAAAASAKPAAARPARAKPADPRPRHSRRSAGSKTDEKKTARSSSRSSRSPRSRAGSASSGGRRGRASAEKNSGNKGVLIGGGLLVVALAVVGVIYMMGGDEGPTADEQQAMNIAAADEQARLDEAAKAAEAKKTAEEQADAAAATKAAAAIAIEAAANKDQTAAAPSPAKRKKGEPITDASQVFDPKSAVEPVPWPADMSNDEIAAISKMIEDFKGGGRAGIDAKKLLQGLGHKALPGIVNALREIDYLDSFEVMTAWEFNKFMEQLTDGTNVGFRPSVLGEPEPLDRADWNARIVVVWRKFALRFNNAEEWEKLMARNRKKK